MDKKINFVISDGMEFYAHEVSINYTPLQFMFDFKTVTPRVDPRSKEDTVISIKHNVIMTDVYHAKRFHQILGNVLKNYEKDFGKINEPNVLKRFKKNKSKESDNENQKQNKETYFG
ncbi:MAG TPA: DUF3467 domain-containing protein [Candidatus Nanoarchaeia archaeon]|nr:DUF3467 domain-containing protein [Candidatus Nanoarchaeia archaeon]